MSPVILEMMLGSLLWKHQKCLYYLEAQPSLHSSDHHMLKLSPASSVLLELKLPLKQRKLLVVVLGRQTVEQSIAEESQGKH